MTYTTPDLSKRYHVVTTQAQLGGGDYIDRDGRPAHLVTATYDTVEEARRHPTLAPIIVRHRGVLLDTQTGAEWDDEIGWIEPGTSLLAQPYPDEPEAE